MPHQHDRVHFRMMEIDFEWDGATRTLQIPPREGSPALRELVRGLIAECAKDRIPAVLAVKRAADRLAQRVTILRIEPDE